MTSNNPAPLKLTVRFQRLRAVAEAAGDSQFVSRCDAAIAGNTRAHTELIHATKKVVHD